MYDTPDCHKIQVRSFLSRAACSTAPIENRDVRYDNLHLVQQCLMDHSSCMFPAEVQQENVPVSILHQADETRLKRRAKKQDTEMKPDRSKLL